MIVLNFFYFMVIPLLVAAGLLGLHAYWRWRVTMDKILRGMKTDDVRKQVKRAVRHRQWARYHATALAVAMVGFIVLNGISATGNNFAFEILMFPMIVWVYCLFMPHMLGLLLYHIRWNPKTMLRKQKLDAEDVVYEGNFDLDADAQYGVNEEGELIQLGLLDETQQRLQS